MEENRNNNSTKRKHYLPIILIAAILILSLVGIGVMILNRQKVIHSNEITKIRTDKMSENEIAQLEDSIGELTEEEVTVLIKEAKKGVQDEATLRKLLLLDEELEITVSKGMKILQKIPVYGKKTLKGNATIQVDLGATVSDMTILDLKDKAQLTMDGLVLDGNGIGSVINVDRGATLNVLSGTIQYAGTYGIITKGTVYIKGGTISDSVAGSVSATGSSKTYITGGVSKNSMKNHLWVTSKATVEVTNYTLDGCWEHAIMSQGTFTWKGGNIVNTSDGALVLYNNAGTCAMTDVEIDGGGSVFNANGGTFKMENVVAHNITGRFAQVKKGNAKITNCKFYGSEKNTDTGIEIYAGTSEIKNIYMENMGVHGFIVRQSAKVNAENIEMVNIGRYGIANCGADTVFKNITIKNAGEAAIQSRNALDTTANQTGTLTLKNVTTENCGKSLQVQNGSTVIAENCTFNKTKSINVYAPNGNLQLSNSKVLGVQDAKDYAVCMHDGSKVTFKNVEVTGGKSGANVIKGSSFTMIGGSIHDNGEASMVGTAMRVTDENSSFYLDGVEIYNNTTNESVGGIIANQKTVGTIKNCKFYNNSCAKKAGALFVNATATVTVEDTLFKQNESKASEGGAIYVDTDANLTLRRCEFIENKSAENGGAISNRVGKITADSCKFVDNTSKKNGGAINTYSATFQLQGCTFKDNSAELNGGAFRASAASVTMNGTKFEDNESSIHGGAISIENNGKLVATDSNIENNKAKGVGGAVFVYDASAEFDECSLENNNATKEGGAIHVYKQSEVIVNGGEIANNEGKSGGGIYNQEGSIKLSSVALKKNTVKEIGAAIYTANTATIKACKFVSNETVKEGGAIYNTKILNIENSCQFIENQSEGSSGAIYNAGTMTLKGTNMFDSNKAERVGGAITNHNTVTIDGSCEFTSNTSRAGGAIYTNKGTITVNDKISFKENEAIAGGDHGGAIFNDGTSVMKLLGESTFDSNRSDNYGGAICNTSTLEIAGSCEFVSNESTKQGGAIYTTKAITMQGCKYVSNAATNEGGAIFITSTGVVEVKDNCEFNENKSTAKNGGAICNVGTFKTTGTNSFTANTAGQFGGAIANYGALDLKGVTTFTENAATSLGGAIYTTAKTEMQGCKFTSNSAAGNDDGAGGAIFARLGSHEFSGTNCTFDGNTSSKSSGWVGAGLYLTGSGTATLINDTKTAETDYDYEKAYFKSHTTNGGGASIIVADGATLNITGYKFEKNSAVGGGAGIYLKGATSNDKDCIYTENTGKNGVAVRVYTGSTFTKNGGRFEGNTSNGDKGSPAIYNQVNCTVTNVTFTNNKTLDNYDGGAVYNTGTLNVNDGCNFIGNQATKNAGAICNTGTLTVTGTNKFVSNTAAGRGGAIANYNKLTMNGDCEFTSNKSKFGGAIYAGSGIVTINDKIVFKGNEITTGGTHGGAIFNDGSSEMKLLGESIFDSNKSVIHGGAICNTSTLEIAGSSEFVSNESAERGGAIYTTKTITLNGCKFTSNKSTKEGGAIFNQGTLNVVDGCKFSENQSKSNAGAMCNTGTLKVAGTNEFTSNTAGQHGGAIGNYGTLELDGVNTFTSNTATVHGGVIFNGSGTLTIKGQNNFNGNIAKNHGGAICNTATINLQGNGTFDSNQATNDGGAIHNAGTLNMSECRYTFSGNTAGVKGGAIRTDKAITVNNCTFTGNIAPSGSNITIKKGVVLTKESNTGLDASTIANH